MDIDFYPIAKLLHVMSALAWAGGGFTMLAQTVLSIREKGEMATIRAAAGSVSLGKYWFRPAVLATFIFGAVTTTLGGLWSESWIILALAGYFATLVTGMVFFERRGAEMGRLMAAGREADALAVGRLILRVQKFDYTVMGLIIADMVIKPTWSDYATLGTGAAVLLLAAAFFLFAPQRPAGGDAPLPA
jgi:hypothetical protein